MKKHISFIILASVVAFAPLQLRSEEKALTFQNCYALAVKQSEQLLQAQEDIEQSKARRRQALGAVLPNLRWGLTTTWQDTSGLNSDDSGVGSTLTKKRRTQSQFTASQPLFQGFKEFSAMSAYKAEEKKNEALLMNRTVNLYLNVAQAFYRVMQLEQFQADTRTSIQLTEDRVKELRGRTRLGKSRDSEVLSAESQLAALQAQEALNAGDIISARDVLGFFIGEDARPLTFVDDLSLPTPVRPEEQYVQLMPNRSDVRANEEDAEAKRYAIKVAQSGFYPFAGLVGNYYTQRPGFQSEIDWDIALNIDVPLFQGGEVKALTREARSVYKQAQLELTRSMRLAESEIRQAHAAFTSSIYESETLQVAYDKAQRSYTAQVKEYRLGSVDNLQVLQALNTMQLTKSNADTSYLQTKLNFLKLKAVTEDIP